ncbi:MAG: aminopeptidase, partial [Butyrivibrio sp.]
MKRKNAWTECDSIKLQKVMEFGEEYRAFISECKTERECTSKSIELAKQYGYSNLKDVIEEGRSLKAGDKVYAVNKGKSLVLFNIGKENIESGMKILGAHIDSPRLDIKQNPLYEDEELVLMDTHYYGGIKKYQWTAIPLALHGVVVLTDGTVINVTLGEDMNDPVVGVSDLLIHLASEQMDKKASKVVEGENLDILVGSMPMGDEDDSKDE